MNFEQARFNMVEQQVRPWEVLDARVLEVMLHTPREAFVPPEYQKLAYSDTQIPLGYDGQVMMQPNVEGRCLQALQIKSEDIILEVGTGSAYLTACLAQLGKHVYSVDNQPSFTQAAQHKLAARGISNITFITGDAIEGWDRLEKYDVVVLTGSVPEIPAAHKHALTLNGRLFAIVGTLQQPVMEAVLLTRTGEQQWRRQSLFETSIAPLTHKANSKPFVF